MMETYYDPPVKVGVVYGDHDIAELVMLSIEAPGVECVEYKDPCTALKQMKTEQPEVLMVLGNFSLSGMKGTELIKQVRANWDDKAMGIFFCCVHLTQQEQEALMKVLKIDDYLPTPFEPTRLRERFNMMMEKRRNRMPSQ
jgi:DNA-binding response OmpR family regulator